MSTHYPYSARVLVAGMVKTESDHESSGAIDLRHRKFFAPKGTELSVRGPSVTDGDGTHWSPIEVSFPEQYVHGWFLAARLSDPPVPVEDTP